MYRVSVDSDVYGYEQFDYKTRREALAGLNRLILKGLREDDGVGRRYTIEKQS